MKNGDIIACRHKFSWTAKGIAFWAIKKLTGKYDHVALVVEINKKIYVQEATMKNGIIRLSLKQWEESEERKDLENYEIIPTKRNPQLWLLDKYLGIKYDYLSYLSHLYYLLKSKWIGHVPVRGAEKRYTCSEWIAGMYNVPEWHKQTPSSLVEYFRNKVAKRK